VSLKLNLSQKLLIAIAAVLCAAGAGKLLYCRIKPFDALLFSIDNLERSAGYEQEARIICRTEAEAWSERSIPAEIVNNTLITVNYKKKANVSKAEFTLSALDTEMTLLSGEIYTEKDLTALSIGGRTLFSGRSKPASELTDSLRDIKDSVTDYLRYSPGTAVTINDYGKPTDMIMDNFSLVMESGESANLIKNLIGTLNNSMPEVFEYLKQIPAHSAQNIYAIFQIDGFMRPRGIQAEIRFNEISVMYEMSITRVSGDISITPADITNGVDIGDLSEDEIEPLLKEFFDSLAGGK
jgi:hypothetical protein